MENDKTAGGLQEQEKRSSDASSTSNEDRNKDLDKAKEVEFTSTTSSSREDHYFNKVEYGCVRIEIDKVEMTCHA